MIRKFKRSRKFSRFNAASRTFQMFVLSVVVVTALSRVSIGLDIYDQTEAQLQSSTNVNVILPTLEEFYPRVSLAKPDVYIVSFHSSEECTATTEECVSMLFVGRELAGSQPRSGGEPIPLVNGVTAQYFPFDPTEPYTNSYLTWIDSDYRYELALPSGLVDRMVSIANDALLGSSE